jgi:hypothetical protein
MSASVDVFKRKPCSRPTGGFYPSISGAGNSEGSNDLSSAQQNLNSGAITPGVEPVIHLLERPLQSGSTQLSNVEVLNKKTIY